MRRLEAGAVQLAVAHQDDRLARKPRTRAQRFVRRRRNRDRDERVDRHGQRAAPRVLVDVGRHLSRDRPDRDPDDVVEQIELGNLLIAHELGQQKQKDDGHKRDQNDLQHGVSPLPQFPFSLRAFCRIIPCPAFKF